MITNLFLAVLEVSLSVSFVIVIMLLLSPLIGRRYSAKWSYLIWIFLAIRLLIPLRGEDMRNAADLLSKWGTQTVSQLTTKETGSDETVLPERAATRRIVFNIPARAAAPLMVSPEKSGITPLDLIAYIWGMGCVISILFNIVCYLFYKRRVVRRGTLLRDAVLLQQLFQIKRELRIKRRIPVVGFSGAASPMLLGFLRPVLVLNDGICERGKNAGTFRKQELYFILKHELVHLKRGDLYVKFLLMAARAFHWFNPLVWLMQREAALAMELSCDEMVVKGADASLKKAYTETLLSVLQRDGGKSVALSTGFYEGKKVMKKRFRHILSKNKKRNGFYILLCAGALTLGLGMLTGCAVLKDKAEAQVESAESQFAQMAGNWRIDFDRTDATIWGSGISEGNSMEISETGTFRYAIGVGVGGTGQCVEKDGAVTVEVEPYESHSSEKEILTLTYGNDAGKETILMDWNGENVYWVRTEQETASDNSGTDNASDRITLTFMKEGVAEEKQAALVVEDGYILYLPVGEWQKEEADLWRASANENVKLWVAGFESGYPVEELFTNDGYMADGDGMTKREDGLFYKVKLYEAENKMWCVLYCYPEEAEEGFGSEMPVIADTFAVVVPGERISETYVAGSRQILGYVSKFENNAVKVDLQDWVTRDDPNWKSEYNEAAGFEIVDIAGADVTYPLRGDCQFFILENHQGESIEIDKEAFAKYLKDTDFLIFWGMEVVEGEIISFAEWYRP